MESNSKVKLTVIMITYGHEKFIEAAINGVFMQQTDFPIELIIANDCSPDSTDVVVEKLLSKALSNVTVKYTGHENNIGMMPNFIWALNQANGKYIALCEGDDYWTDPLKLQKQVDYLEQNKTAAMCFHSSQIKDENTGEVSDEVPAQNRMYSSDDLLLSKVAHTASFVFKSNIIDYEKISNKAVFGGDVMLALLLADQCEVFGMQDYMSVYRKHAGGVTNISAKDVVAHQKRMVGQYVYMKENLKSVSADAFSRKLFDHAITVASLSFKQKKYFTAIQYGVRAISYRPEFIYKILSKPFKKVKK